MLAPSAGGLSSAASPRSSPISDSVPNPGLFSLPVVPRFWEWCYPILSGLSRLFCVTGPSGTGPYPREDEGLLDQGDGCSVARLAEN